MPTRAQVHIDQALTDFAIAKRILPFVAEQLFPIVKVVKESDKYYIFDREEMREHDTLRAPGAEAKEFEWGSTSATYNAEEHSLRHLVADRIANNADAPIKPFMRTTQKLMNVIMLGVEKRVKTLVMNGGLTGSTPVSGKKWDQSGAEIETNIDLAKQTIGKNAGVLANTILMNTEVKDAFKKDATIRNLIRYTIAGSGGQELLVNGELPPVIFNLRPIIAEGIENTGKKGAAESVSRIWPNAALVCYVEPNPDIEAMSLGYQFRVNDWVVMRYRVDTRKGDMVEPSVIQDEKVVATAAGYLLHSVLA